MSEDNPFLITPPPGIAPKKQPERAPEVAAEPERVAHPEEFISLPPGITDSATHRHPAPTTPAAPVTFFAATPGAPPPRAVSWALRLPDGSTLAVGRALFLGRNPTATADLPDAALRPIDDPARSLSKTHALVELEDDRVWISDLNSTNGVVIAAPGQPVVVVEPGRRAEVPRDAELRLGSFVMTLVHV